MKHEGRIRRLMELVLSVIVVSMVLATSPLVREGVRYMVRIIRKGLE